MIPSHRRNCACALDHLVQIGQHHSKNKAENVRVGRVLQRPQPRAVAPPVRMRDAIGIECHVESAGDQAQCPHSGHLDQVRRHPLRALPLRHPGKDHVVDGLGRHRPRRRIQKSGHRRNKALQQQRRQYHARPEHRVGVALVFRRSNSQAQQQAEKVNGINARKSRLPEALAVQFSIARPVGVVIGQHESRQQNEIADRDKAGVDHRRQKPEPLWIGEVEEDDVDGRETAQACQCFQRRWLASLHEQLDVSGRQGTVGNRDKGTKKTTDIRELGASASNRICAIGVRRVESPDSGPCCSPLVPVPCFYAVTSDPTFSPSTTRRMFPG